VLTNSASRKSDANTLCSTGPPKSTYQISEFWLDLQASGEILEGKNVKHSVEKKHENIFKESI